MSKRLANLIMNYIPNNFTLLPSFNQLAVLMVICSITYPVTGRATETNADIPVLMVDDLEEGRSTPLRKQSDEDLFVTPEGQEFKSNHTEDSKRELADSYVAIMNFQQGDLLYGLKDSRRFIREKLQTIYHFGAVTIDSYNKTFLSINKDKTKNWKDLDEALESVLLEPDSGLDLVEDNHPWARNYAKFLFNDGIFDRIDDHVVAENRKFKKISCKYALIFSKLVGCKIHFVLDQLEFYPVVFKKVDDFGEEKFVESYTASELRYLYRMWMNNRKGIDHVYFYRSGKRLESPPWINRPTFWRNYRSKSDNRSVENQGLSESYHPEWQQDNLPTGKETGLFYLFNLE